MAFPVPQGGYAPGGVNYLPVPAGRFFTYLKPKKGRDPKDVLKLARGQVAHYMKAQGGRPGGYYAGPASRGGRPAPRPGATAAAGARSMQDFTVEQFAALLQKNQQSSLDALLANSRETADAEKASMAGFGAALQGYSHDLWNQTNEAYRNAAAQQQSMAAGLGGQMGSGVAEMRAQEAALAGSLGHTGASTLPAAEVAAAQVASEGGARTGDVLNQVGTAWGGYGATRPEYIGFMTGQNMAQVERERGEGDQELRAKFLELGMDNPKNALEMWGAMQTNRRENVSTSLAQQTLKTNIAMQKAKIKQDYEQMRLQAKTAGEKLRLDRWYKNQQIALDEQDLLIDQQGANTADTRASIAQQNANTGQTRAQIAQQNANTAKWKAEHPASSQKFVTGTYQQKIATAMNATNALFGKTGGNRAEYAFKTLWPQIAPYVEAGNKEAAKRLLRTRLKQAAKAYKPKPTADSGNPYGISLGD